MNPDQIAIVAQSRIITELESTVVQLAKENQLLRSQLDPTNQAEAMVDKTEGNGLNV